MAFANLFTSLAAVEKDVRSPAQENSPHRKETGRGRGRKRKTPGEQTAPPEKRPCYQTRSTRAHSATFFKYDDHRAERHHRKNPHYEQANVSLSNKAKQSHHSKPGHYNTSHKGQNNKNKNKQEEQKKRREWQKNEGLREERGRPAGRGGGPALRRGGGDRRTKTDTKVERTRFMTQEFKDKHAISVDNRLVCKFFLMGKCTKGDECQLEHAQCRNDLFKSVCKFYVQETCFKGATCPFMHKSFPCKFFHNRGQCLQGANCKFSHERLNDLTRRLLDEALERDKELAKKAGQVSSVQQVNQEESESTEANKTPDFLLNPQRPSFYQSAETDVQEKPSSPRAEELTENKEEAVTPHAAQLHSSLLANSNQTEPVCYSVKAVLGPQLSKPFPSFYTAPKTQGFLPLCSSDRRTESSANANQSQAPYSVEAVLKSFKSVETPTYPTEHTGSYPQKTDFKESTDPLSSSTNVRIRGQKSQEKLFQSLPSFEPNSSLISDTCALASGVHERQVWDMQDSVKPALDVKTQGEPSQSSYFHTDIKHAPSSDSEGADHLKTNKQKTVASASSSQRSSSSEHPVMSKPHICVMTPDSRASYKPTKFKGKATALTKPISTSIKSSNSADSLRLLTSEQHVKGDLHSKEITADCSSEVTDGCRLTGGCKTTSKISFRNLFAKPITDSLQPKDDSVMTPADPQGLIQSSSPALKSSLSKSNPPKTASESVKAPARPFASLFSTPLSTAPLPSMHSLDDSRTTSGSQRPDQKVETAPCNPNSKQREDNFQTQRPDKDNMSTPLRADVQVSNSPNSSPGPKKGNKSSNECREQIASAACPVNGSPSEQSTCPPLSVYTKASTHDNQPPPKISSPKETAPKSILRTLFQSLSPYQQDGEQERSPSSQIA
ncbi:uncharacterized protein LOC117815974 isoform X2 [Xyrichtys novacula]|uniref:Uncharacterized protein LOC117815974 isoform X2 n=1 Tax=Xyrichtys novacula TaxID=13765 RepID=A0AAV1EW47_XYRNO|nr:uncharacterized protein LOC117815974 isoform X2 [Xyrichtys novacula]